MNHRGRFQAQGRKLEESEAWAQPAPLYLQQGKSLLSNLKEKIPLFELRKRAEAFQTCEQFIERASQNGGINIVDKPLRKSFPRNETERVDLEVLKGNAFLP
ncbi:hypothetical protein [Spirosoma rhododendri]|uniref:Uncharacterized protein n=1 Tax=Spirosoma rhododendri TaxID=2728024 RepID=A0A7L5DMF6_9BACT|nr:hypothetical protein [Spirosoma rhododendri]QJD78671.1 hypothetical protein HH216_09715 [Spirosoma rhododendri]